MNKKIISEIAIGVILLVVIAVGGLFWLQSKQDLQTVPVRPQTEQERLRELIAKDAAEQQKILDEKEAKSKELSAKIEAESAKNKEVNSKRTLEEKIIIQLADAMENNEPLDKTHIVIDQQVEHYIKGRVFFDLEPKKNGLFYATENASYKSNNKSVVWDEMRVVFNEGYDPIECSIADGYSFPKAMSNNCMSGNPDNFQSPDSGRWKLIGGDPNENCSKVLYSGKIKIRGWYEWRSTYGNKDWVLSVDNRDMNKLLPNWSGYYSLSNASELLVSQLKNASKENPLTITVNELGFYCEGLPWLKL
jgi:hypothetical protein